MPSSSMLNIIIKWRKKKYDTVGTVLTYDTVGTVLKYDTVGTVLRYDTVGTVLKCNIKIIQRRKLDTHSTHICAILAWYMHFNKQNGGVTLVSEMMQVMQVLSTCE
jgi:hypothetical protein